MEGEDISKNFVLIFHKSKYSWVMWLSNDYLFRVPEDVYDNGGDWLMNVFPVGYDYDNQRLIGFVHAEDQFYDPETGFPGYEAYKSIALGTSFVIKIKWN